MPSAVVAIFVHRPELQWWEKISLQQCAHVLAAHPLRLVCPDGLDVSEYVRIAPQLQVDRVAASRLASYRAYNRFKIDPEFYRRYAGFEFLLTYELDALVFRDELEYWSTQPWDYIGAPAFSGYLDAAADAAPVPLQNSGFSLRRIESCRRVLASRRYIVPPREVFRQWRERGSRTPGSMALAARRLTLGNNFWAPLNDFGGNEDDFWCNHAAQRFDWFRLAPFAEARRFSFEANAPRLFAENGGRLPFGCHRWAQAQLDFWRPHVEALGYEIPPRAMGN